MRIYLASDHAGFELKGVLIAFLRGQGNDPQKREPTYDVQDLGPHRLDPDDDYPDFVVPLAKLVAAELHARGIVIGGSGEGEAMAANRVLGARAAVYYGSPGGRGEEILRLSREHNDANILSLGARFLTAEEAKAAVQFWLENSFSNDARHIRRLAKF